MRNRGVLVIGPAGRVTREIARVARDRGGCVVLAMPGGGEDAEGPGLPCLSVDIDSDHAAEELFERAASVLPNLVVVIVVSTVPPLAAIHEVSLDRWRDSVDDPLRRVFWLVRRAIEQFLMDGVNGRLVLVAECVDDDGVRIGTNHVVSAALESLVRCFAREYGRRGLACNLVVHMDSLEAAQTSRGGVRDSLSSVVEQALFFASPDASFVNGEALVVR